MTAWLRRTFPTLARLEPEELLMVPLVIAVWAACVCGVVDGIRQPGGPPMIEETL